MPKATDKSGVKNIEKQKGTNILTQTNLEPNTDRMQLSAKSLPSLQTLQGHIHEEARTELRFPQSMQIYKQMLLDANIASAISLIELMISRVPWEVKTPSDASEEDKKRAKILNYNMLVMERPWDEYINEILSYVAFGFHASEKVYKRYKNTPVGDFVGWKTFGTVSQDTISKWLFDNKSGRLVGLKQDLNLIASDSRRTTGSNVELPRKKFMLFRHSPKRDNPEGRSPFKSIYVSWKYKSLIEEIETIGASKDLCGSPIIGVDTAYLAKATTDPNGDEAAVVNELKRQAAALHSGDQTYILKPISYTETGKELFTFDLVGINGGGKQYNTDDIVKRYDSRILMSFFADVLQLGNDSHGSFALADSKTSILAMGIEGHLNNIKRTLNHDLIRQTYELNGWEYDPRSSCSFEFGDLEKEDLDVLSSGLQRIAATGLMRPTDDIETELRQKFLGLESVADAKPEILETEQTSRSGDGLKSAGEGTSNSTGGKGGADASVANKEN